MLCLSRTQIDLFPFLYAVWEGRIDRRRGVATRRRPATANAGNAAGVEGEVGVQLVAGPGENMNALRDAAAANGAVNGQNNVGEAAAVAREPGRGAAAAGGENAAQADLFNVAVEPDQGFIQQLPSTVPDPQVWPGIHVDVVIILWALVASIVPGWEPRAAPARQVAAGEGSGAALPGGGGPAANAAGVNVADPATNGAGEAGAVDNEGAAGGDGGRANG